MIDLSLILPVQNEEHIISSVYRDIRHTLDRLSISYECILVENGSTDQSLVQLIKLKKRYHRTTILTAPRGYGSAVIAGLSRAGGTFVSYMPSDGQIDLTVLPKLWAYAKTGDWDMVKVKRVTREHWVRFVTSFLFSLTTRFLFHTPPLDINGSPRIFLRKYLALLDLQAKDSFIDAEFAAKAAVLEWKIKEIPMKTLPRRGGASTRSLRTYVEFFRNFLVYKKNIIIERWAKHLHDKALAVHR